MFYVIISEKGGAERRETFDQECVNVGRVQGNDLMLPKGNVSKRHCSLTLQDGRFLVSDQNSTNGTYVNRRRISQPTAVRQGDRIYVGDFVLRIDETEPASEQPSAAPIASSAPAPGIVDEPSSSGAPVGAISLPPRPEPGPGSQNRTLSALEQPPSLQPPELLAAVAETIRRVQAKLEPRLLERAMDPAAEQRVERMVGEVIDVLRGEGSMAAELDVDLVSGFALDELLRLGPLTALLAQPDITEVALSGALHGMCVRASGHATPVALPFCAPESIARVAGRLCRAEGLELPREAMPARIWLPSLGAQLEVLMGSVAPQGGTLRLTRASNVRTELDDLVRSGTVSRSMATFLRHCVHSRLNILLVGLSDSGVSQVLTGLSRAVVGERVLAVVADGVYPVNHADCLPLDLSGSTPEEMGAVLISTANLAGHRLLISHFAANVALGILRATAQGARGVLACLPARTAGRGLSQLCAELALTHGLALDSVVEAIGATFDVAVEVSRLADGRCRVTRISELARGEQRVELQAVFEFVVERTATGGSVEGTFRATGHSPALVDELRARGIRIESSLFSRSTTSE